MQSIEKVQSRINPSLEIYGVLVTMFTRTLHSDEVLQRIYEAFGDKVFHSVISRSIKLPDANVAAAPITFFAHNHKTAKEYREVAREMIYRDIVAYSTFLPLHFSFFSFFIVRGIVWANSVPPCGHILIVIVTINDMLGVDATGHAAMP